MAMIGSPWVCGRDESRPNVDAHSVSLLIHARSRMGHHVMFAITIASSG